MQSTSFPVVLSPLAIFRSGRHRLVLGVLALGVIAIAAGSQWSWLVAIGVAPLLLSIAPCAAMCGLGLCMHRMGGGKCSAPPQIQSVSGTTENPSIPKET
jgi:hypothetical protein